MRSFCNQNVQERHPFCDQEEEVQVWIQEVIDKPLAVSKKGEWSLFTYFVMRRIITNII